MSARVETHVWKQRIGEEVAGALASTVHPFERELPTPLYRQLWGSIDRGDAFALEKLGRRGS